MSTIPADQLVSVTPSVVSAGGAALDVIGLVLTNGTRAPIGSVQSFPNALAVSNYFGAGSHEAALAAVYFGGFSGSDTLPAALLFAQYPQSAVAAYLRGGDVAGLTLTQLQAISGSLDITIDGFARNAASVNLSSATSFSNAASIIATALNAGAPSGASFTGSITGNTLTVTGSVTGTIAVGQELSGTSITGGTFITALGTGTGGDGTYTVSASQTVGSESITSAATPVAVTFDSVSGAFVVTSGITGAPSTAAYATGSIAASLMLTAATGAVLSQGAAAATPAAFMNGVIAVTTNWVCYMTSFDPDMGSGNAQKQLFAAWKNTALGGNRFAYVCWDTDITATESVPATGSLGYVLANNEDSGTCVVYQPSDLLMAAFICGAAASIDFEETNGRITFAYKWQSGLTAGVTTATAAQNLLGNGYCFGGAYGAANANFTWFQNGQCTGPYAWLDSYINQIWLNNQFQLALLNLLGNMKSVPFNTAGAGLIQAACQPVIQAGLTFGAFAPGAISAAQIAEVNAAAGASIATSLQTQGWYLQVNQTSSAVRATRGPWQISFWYLDRGSVQTIDLNSILVQ